MCARAATVDSAGGVQVGAPDVRKGEHLGKVPPRTAPSMPQTAASANCRTSLAEQTRTIQIHVSSAQEEDADSQMRPRSQTAPTTPEVSALLSGSPPLRPLTPLLELLPESVHQRLGHQRTDSGTVVAEAPPWWLPAANSSSRSSSLAASGRSSPVNTSGLSVLGFASQAVPTSTSPPSVIAASAQPSHCRDLTTSCADQDDTFLQPSVADELPCPLAAPRPALFPSFSLEASTPSRERSAAQQRTSSTLSWLSAGFAP